MKEKESPKILSIINPREIKGSKDCDEYGFPLIGVAYLSSPDSLEQRVSSKMIDVRKQLDECLRLYSSKKGRMSEKVSTSLCQDSNITDCNTSSEVDLIKKEDIISNEFLQFYGISEY